MARVRNPPWNKILMGFLGSLVLYAVAKEVAQAGPKVPLPPGATAVSFGDLGGDASAAEPNQAKAGDYLKALPASVRKLDNRQVLIQGFMIPTQLEGRGVRQFLLVRSQANCCFGFPLRVGDVVVVRMDGKPAGSLMDRTLAVVGRFHVQENWNGNFLGSLYQLDASSVTAISGPDPRVLGKVRSPE